MSTDPSPTDAAVHPLQARIEADVSSRLAALPGVSPSVLSAFQPSVPGIVRTTLDMAVQLGGSLVESMAEGHAGLVQQYVSDKSLEYLEGVIHALRKPHPE